jgi:hypothetical protein
VSTIYLIRPELVPTFLNRLSFDQIKELGVPFVIFRVPGAIILKEQPTFQIQLQQDRRSPSNRLFLIAPRVLNFHHFPHVLTVHNFSPFWGLDSPLSIGLFVVSSLTTTTLKLEIGRI